VSCDSAKESIIDPDEGLRDDVNDSDAGITNIPEGGEVKVPCFRPNRVATNQRGTQPVDWERQPTAFWWYRISGKTANVPATEFTISAVEDRRCHAWGHDGSNQSAMLASCTAVMQYVVGESRVCFASGAFTATRLCSLGRPYNRRLYHNAFTSNRPPSTDCNPQFMCVLTHAQVWTILAMIVELCR
jgi:hypothetical protein